MNYVHCRLPMNQKMTILLSGAAITQLYPGIVEVKSTKRAATVMIRDNVKPNDASYHSIIHRLYKGRTRNVCYD